MKWFAGGPHPLRDGNDPICRCPILQATREPPGPPLGPPRGGRPV